MAKISGPTRVSHDTRERIMAGRDRAIEVSASDLKNSWHEYLEQVARGRQEVVVTRYGRPIARLSPVESTDESRGLFGWMSGTVTVHEDIVAPVGEAWEVDA
jgi:prevent-host-death family protein